MKKTIVVLLVVLALTLAASAKSKPQTSDFNLTARITAVSTHQEYSSSGSVSTNDDGKVSGSSNGNTFTVYIFTVKIDGDPITYQMQRSAGWTKHMLHIGDYKGCWKGHVLEVILTDDKGKEKTQSLFVVGEQH